MSSDILIFLGPLAGLAVGAILTWLTQSNLSAKQAERERVRAQEDRIVSLRWDFVKALQVALADLIAIAIREVPERPRRLGDEFSLDPDTWAQDWKLMREQQDLVRERMNKLGFMSPYRSTLIHAKKTVEAVDSFAKAEDAWLVFYESDGEPANEAEGQAWTDKGISVGESLDETREALLATAYAFRRHLEALVTVPGSDPG